MLRVPNGQRTAKLDLELIAGSVTFVRFRVGDWEITLEEQPREVAASEIAGTRLVWNPGDAAEDMEPIRPHPRWKLKGR